MQQMMFELSARLFVMGGLIVFIVVSNPFLVLKYEIDKVVNSFMYGLLLMLFALYIVFISLVMLLDGIIRG